MVLKCIYCNSSGPFSSEHIFPYSLGGGGQGWTLNNCVCKECNNLFSSLERELARSSIEALQRTIYGPAGRKENNKFHKVPIYSDNIFYLPQNNDLIYEGGLALGFNPYLRAQIIEIQFPENKITGSDKNELKHLVKKIKKTFNNNLQLILDLPSKKGEGIKIANLELREKKLKITSIERVKNIDGGIWLRSFPEDIEDRRLTPRIFLDDEKRLVVRAKSKSEAVEFLGPVIWNFLHKEIKCTNKIKNAKSYTTTSNPKYSFNVSFNFVKVARAVAKIGLNFSIKSFGKKFAKDADFNDIKKFILGTKHNNYRDAGNYFQMVDPEKPSLFKIIDTSYDKHWVILTYMHDTLLFCIKFYGGSEYIINLGVKKPNLDSLVNRSFKIFTVDYSERQVKELTPEEIAKLIKTNLNFI